MPENVSLTKIVRVSKRFKGGGRLSLFPIDLLCFGMMLYGVISGLVPWWAFLIYTLTTFQISWE